MPPKVPRAPRKGMRTVRGTVGDTRKKLDFGQKGQIRKDRQRLRDLFSRPEFVDWERTSGGFGPMRDKNAWVAALRVFNANNKHTFCTPRRGSPEYDAVKAIQAQFEAGAMYPKPNMPGKRFSSHSRIERIPQKRMSAAARAKLEKERDAEVQRIATARQAAESDRMQEKYTGIARKHGGKLGFYENPNIWHRIEKIGTVKPAVQAPPMINAKPAGEKRRIVLATVA